MHRLQIGIAIVMLAASGTAETSEAMAGPLAPAQFDHLAASPRLMLRQMCSGRWRAKKVISIRWRCMPTRARSRGWAQTPKPQRRWPKLDCVGRFWADIGLMQINAPSLPALGTDRWRRRSIPALLIGGRRGGAAGRLWHPGPVVYRAAGRLCLWRCPDLQYRLIAQRDS